jgi:hypothetical protein
MKVEIRPGLQGFTGLYGALVFLVRFAGAAGKPLGYSSKGLVRAVTGPSIADRIGASIFGQW